MLYPIKFAPFLREMVWGGEKILPLKQLEADVHRIGESWEISGYPQHETCVAEGPLKGTGLNRLVQTYREALVGKKLYQEFGDTFPLLVRSSTRRRTCPSRCTPATNWRPCGTPASAARTRCGT